MGKSLGEIAERFPLRSGLFCIKSEMIGITQHAFEKESGLGKFFRDGLTRACQGFYQPERAHVERPLLSRQSVNPRLWWITVDEAIAQETAIPRTLMDGRDGVQHPGVIGGHEEYKRHDQKRCVQVVASVRLSERGALLVP